MQDGAISIKQAGDGELSGLWALINDLGLARDVDYFEQNLALQAEGGRQILIVSFDGYVAGYCILNWEPKYNLFKKLGIAEIQDLNILPRFRKKGIGSALIKYCEDQAKLRGLDDIGIAVGLNSSFGAAQRLYVRLGYVPDGNGATYDRKPVQAGESKPVDDDLCLMMVKNLT